MRPWLWLGHVYCTEVDLLWSHRFAGLVGHVALCFHVSHVKSSSSTGAVGGKNSACVQGVMLFGGWGIVGE